MIMSSAYEGGIDGDDSPELDDMVDFMMES
jgi:hypothetical protein